MDNVTKIKLSQLTSLFSQIQEASESVESVKFADVIRIVLFTLNNTLQVSARYGRYEGFDAKTGYNAIIKCAEDLKSGSQRVEVIMD